MEIKDFRIALEDCKTMLAKAKMTGKVEYLDKGIDKAHDLLAELNKIARFDGQEDKVEIESIVLNSAVAVIKNKNSNIADLNIAYYLYKNAGKEYEDLNSLVEEARSKVQNLIDGAKAFKEACQPAKQPAPKTAPKS